MADSIEKILEEFEVEKLMREVKQKQKEKGVTDEAINKRDKS